jgi:nicotinate-nucleotide pyrophosphorylase (carboxylating)
LTDAQLDAAISRWLDEDVGTGDVTTKATIPSSTNAYGEFIAKATGMLAGSYVAERVFRSLDPSIETSWFSEDGMPVSKGDIIGTVTGPAAGILVGERLALNVVQRMSGIATATAQMVKACGTHRARILDTRKTAPGLRLLDKWAVVQGGGVNHRIGLYDMIMIKDNHIAAAGGIRQAVAAAHAFRQRSGKTELEIELETRTLEEVRIGAALEPVDRLLLDNMVRIADDGSVDTSMLIEALRIVGRRKTTEASGNVTLSTVPAIAATGVDFISSGALTHSVTALDISLGVVLRQ